MRSSRRAQGLAAGADWLLFIKGETPASLLHDNGHKMTTEIEMRRIQLLRIQRLRSDQITHRAFPPGEDVTLKLFGFKRAEEVCFNTTVLESVLCKRLNMISDCKRIKLKHQTCSVGHESVVLLHHSGNKRQQLPHRDQQQGQEGSIHRSRRQRGN